MRKIEVQSPEDIRFILENLSSAARAKINHYLPPTTTTTTTTSDNNDELRKRVEDMVMEVYPPALSSLPPGARGITKLTLKTNKKKVRPKNHNPLPPLHQHKRSRRAHRCTSIPTPLLLSDRGGGGRGRIRSVR